MGKKMILSINKKIQTFLLKKNSISGPLRFVGRENEQKSEYQNHMRALFEKEGNFLLTTGLGLPEEFLIPVRLPAIIIAGLEMMDHFKKSDMPVPNYIIYQATEFTAEINQIEVTGAKKRALIMKAYLREYVKKTHPDLVKYIHFIFGKDVPDMKKSIEKMDKKLRKLAQGNKKISTDLDRLSEYSFARNPFRSYERAIQYAAGNIVYNGGIEDYPFKKISKANTIVLIGGRKEKRFFELTSLFSKNTKRKIIPLICQAGESPTYYESKKGDITSSEQISEAEIKKMPAMIKYDFELLIKDCKDIELLKKIYKKTVESDLKIKRI
ncbi:MAG: hypothetical protein JXQ74_03600 [Alphaproteobacteria bacterium]|nr:hypothetical protein [Alphaproteobacteria bacterium]